MTTVCLLSCTLPAPEGGGPAQHTNMLNPWPGNSQPWHKHMYTQPPSGPAVSSWGTEGQRESAQLGWYSCCWLCCKYETVLLWSIKFPCQHLATKELCKPNPSLPSCHLRSLTISHLPLRGWGFEVLPSHFIFHTLIPIKAGISSTVSLLSLFLILKTLLLFTLKFVIHYQQNHLYSQLFLR